MNTAKMRAIVISNIPVKCLAKRPDLSPPDKIKTINSEIAAPRNKVNVD